MNKIEKIDELKKLEESIRLKKIQLEKENSELKLLEQEYEIKNISEIPILLFIVDETLPMPDRKSDWQYEYVYYFPDLGKIDFKYFHSKNELLPNTVNLTEKFKNIGLPEKIYPGSIQTCNEYHSKLEYAVSLLKSQIDTLFISYEINSWSDLAIYLTEQDSKKVKSK